jgi:hypothetical protein
MPGKAILFNRKRVSDRTVVWIMKSVTRQSAN